MYIKVKRLDKHDFHIYQNCYQNAEFKYYIYGKKDIDIKKTFEILLSISNNCGEYYAVSYKLNNDDSVYKDMGFCNFRQYEKYPFKTDQETYAINGGVLPELFNKGYGIYGCVSLVYLFFINHPLSLLYASTFSYNNRSSKMLSALGFKRLKESIYDKNHFIINKDDFMNNGFVTQILNNLILDT